MGTAAPTEREKTGESYSAEAGNKELPHTEPQEPEPELGRWFHVSDTHVAEVTLDKVFKGKAQAYLLFYERIV